PLLLIEGPKFPSFNFQFSSNASTDPQNFKIKNHPIYLYHGRSPSEAVVELDAEDIDVEIKDHAVRTATSVWDAGLILAKFLEKQEKQSKINFTQKNFLELGSGKAIPSLTAAILGAKKVITTDVPDITPRIKKIVKLNGLENNIIVKPLDWLSRENLPESIVLENDPLDFIMGADIVWVDYLIQPLVETIDALSTPLRTKLILSHQTRTIKSDKMFFEGLKKMNWKVEKISRDELNWEEGFTKDGVEIYYGYKELTE
ncbi:326_t:CDS:2, partial [Acaulospora morrowiae]